MKKIEFKRESYAIKIMDLCYCDILTIREGAKLLDMNRETFRAKYKVYKAEQEKKLVDLSKEEF